MDSSVDGNIIRQKFFRVQNQVERFKGDCLLKLQLKLPCLKDCEDTKSEQKH